jgi:hypothetical protein
MIDKGFLDIVVNESGKVEGGLIIDLRHYAKRNSSRRRRQGLVGVSSLTYFGILSNGIFRNTKQAMVRKDNRIMHRSHTTMFKLVQVTNGLEEERQLTIQSSRETIGWNAFYLFELQCEE